MLAANRDALLCDLAETYGIYDFRALPVSTLATLAVGLRDDSRIKMYMIGAKAPRSELMLAAVVDRLSLLAWMKSDDGKKGINRPQSLLDAILGARAEESPVEAFETAEDYESAWAQITGVAHGR